MVAGLLKRLIILVLRVVERLIFESMFIEYCVS